MALFYRLIRNDGAPHVRAPFIVGISREFKLPAMTCARCGTWGASGLEYPGISKAELPPRLQTVGAQPISVTTWHALADATGFAAERVIDVRPGSCFGSLIGRQGTTESGLVWRSNWTLLVDEGHAMLLAQLGCPLATVPTPCTNEAGHRMLEIDIREGVGGVVTGGRGGSPRPCAECGRVKPAEVDNTEVRFSTAHQERPLQRISGRPDTIVATEAFVDAARRLGLKTVDAVAVRARHQP